MSSHPQNPKNRIFQVVKDLIRKKTVPNVSAGAETVADAYLPRDRALIEFAFDAFIGMDTSGRIIDWNRQAEKTFGWKRDEVLGAILSDVVIPENFREAHRRGLEKFLETGSGPVLNRRMEVTALHRLGHEVPVELTIYPIQQGDEVIFGAFLHDISEQKLNAQLQDTQLRVTEALTKYGNLQDVIPELLERICKGMSWSVGEFWLNDSGDGEGLRCAGMWGAPEIQGMDFLNITKMSRFPKGVGIPGRVWESGEPQWIEDISQDDNFPRKKEADSAGIRSSLAFPLKTSGSVLGVMAFYSSKINTFDARLASLVADIGNYVGLFIQRKQAEEKLTRLYSELEVKIAERTKDLETAYEQATAANRLKDEFLATVSHELRTPLGVILGYTELILETPMSEDEKVEALQTIRRSGKTQIQIISDLLDVSRIITGKMQLDIDRVDLRASIDSAVDTISMAASAKHIEISTDIDPTVGAIRGDADRLQQILWNLLTNAVKFTPKHGHVQINLKGAPSKAVIEVIDNGKGIEPKFLPYVFERFTQEDASTTRRYGGLGLGLAIVRHLVEAHGGTVEVESDGAGFGTKFILRFPLMAFRDMKSGKERSYFGVPEYILEKPLTGLQILAVEDDSDTRDMIGKILTNAGAKPVLAGTVKEGFKYFREKKPDLILSDISMPEQDGYEFISMVRSLPPERGGQVPAIAFTAHARQEEKNMMLSEGFDLQISKPVEAGELVAKIKKVIESTSSRRVV
ncbi:ATP-binding protein [Bdellovibrio sp. HCB337]|uniref:PAS domain-containing hybrid sensor histidine kinase/response regulator n=1 Tax=Bdellovibrio sp. HCB337 TaxID=3394358 RepID=UPI0039A50360